MLRKTWLLTPLVCAVAATSAWAVEAIELPRPAEAGTVMTLSGEASKKLENDEATVIFSIEVQKKDVAAATNDTIKAVNAAVDAIKAIQGKVELQTADFSTRAVYTKAKEGETPTVGAWVVRQTLRVTVNDMTLVPSVMEAGLKTLTVDGIELRVSDELRKRTQDELLGEAIHDAMARAVRVAKVMGLEAADVRIESIGTGRMSGPSVRYYAAPRVANDAVLAKSVMAAPSVSAGTSDVTQEVTMQVRIRP